MLLAITSLRSSAGGGGVGSCLAGPLDQAGVQEALEVAGVLPDQPLLLLLHDLDAPQLGHPLLLDLLLLLRLGLPVLVELDLPQPLHLSPVLLLLHPPALPSQLVEPVLLGEALQHLGPEVPLEPGLLLPLLLPQLALLPLGLLQHPPELPLLPLLLLVPALLLLLPDELVVVQPQLLQLFDFPLALLLGQPHALVDGCLFLLPPRHLLLLPPAALVQPRLVLRYPLQLLLVAPHLQRPRPLLHHELLLHRLVQLLLPLLSGFQLPLVLPHQPCHFPVHPLPLLLVLPPRLPLQLLPPLHLLPQHPQVLPLLRCQSPLGLLPPPPLLLGGLEHLCLLLGLESALVEGPGLLVGHLLGALLAEVGGVDLPAHGLELGVAGDDAVDLGLLAGVLPPQPQQFLRQLFVGQFHIDYYCMEAGELTVLRLGDTLNFPLQGQLVGVHYSLRDDQQRLIESTHQWGRPFEWRVGQASVLPQLDAAVRTLSLGGRLRLVTLVPHSHAHSQLSYELELLYIK